MDCGAQRGHNREDLLYDVQEGMQMRFLDPDELRASARPNRVGRARGAAC